MINIELLRKIDRIHPYPAKYPIDLAIKYIENYTRPDDTVFDPFVGSGTTLLAASVLNRNGYGTDINHIAILIAQFKTLILSDKDILELECFIDTFENSYSQKVLNIEPEYYESIDHWFCKDSISVLSLIKKEIKSLSEEQSVFCKLVMSTIIKH